MFIYICMRRRIDISITINRKGRYTVTQKLHVYLCKTVNSPMSRSNNPSFHPAMFFQDDFLSLLQINY